MISLIKGHRTASCQQYFHQFFFFFENRIQSVFRFGTVPLTYDFPSSWTSEGLSDLEGGETEAES